MTDTHRDATTSAENSAPNGCVRDGMMHEGGEVMSWLRSGRGPQGDMLLRSR